MKIAFNQLVTIHSYKVFLSAFKDIILHIMFILPNITKYLTVNNTVLATKIVPLKQRTRDIIKDSCNFNIN